MNYETAIELAKQRMREINKTPDQYHIEPVSIIGTAQERHDERIKVNAFNQYYFLVNDESYYGFEMVSDTAYFNADDHSNDTRQEFTGQINIRKTNAGGNWSLEVFEFGAILAKQYPIKFIRVTIF